MDELMMKLLSRELNLWFSECGLQCYWSTCTCL